MARFGSLFIAALLVVAACGGSDDGGNGSGTGGDGATTTAAPTTTATSASTTTNAAAQCSASEARAPQDQPGLPAAVADMREEILDAALACDYQRLEELALAGEGTFTFSFGGGDSPGEHWRRLEESDREGPEPMRYLVGLLDRPYEVKDVAGGEDQFVWPSAFAYDSWADVPEEEKQALKPLYTEDDFEFFEQFGGYIGYRIGITADGDWIFFVAGD